MWPPIVAKSIRTDVAKTADRCGQNRNRCGHPWMAHLTVLLTVLLTENPRARVRAREDGRGKALARLDALNATARSTPAYHIAKAFSASLPVPIETGLLAGIGVQIDKCLRTNIPPHAIAAGLKAWTESTSWSPTQIPNFVHKANNGRAVGAATTKALGYDAALNELLREVTTL